MSKPNYIIREILVSDCEEIRDIWSMADFMVFKDINQIMLKVDPKGILVAADLDSGLIFIVFL